MTDPNNPVPPGPSLTSGGPKPGISGQLAGLLLATAYGVAIGAGTVSLAWWALG